MCLRECSLGFLLAHREIIFDLVPDEEKLAALRAQNLGQNKIQVIRSVSK